MNRRRMMIAATVGAAALGFAGLVALAGYNAKLRDDDDEDEREGERERNVLPGRGKTQQRLRYES